jgi:hypothetical protein
MLRYWKRIAALVLTACLLLSVVPANPAATTTEEPYEYDLIKNFHTHKICLLPLDMDFLICYESLMFSLKYNQLQTLVYNKFHLTFLFYYLISLHTFLTKSNYLLPIPLSYNSYFPPKIFLY